MPIGNFIQTLIAGGITPGTGALITRYPTTAAGTQLKASGNTTGAWKYAAANANVKAIVAKATIATAWQFAWFALDTPSAVSLFVIKLGHGAAAAGAFSGSTMELQVNYTTVTAVGVYAAVMIWIPYSPQVQIDSATDGVLADAASSNAAADDTINCAVGIMTFPGT